MNMEKMKEVFSDEAFVKSLFALETAAEVQTALKEKDIELTEEEILSVRELLLKVENGEIPVERIEQWAAQVNDGELPDELLKQVSGGSFTALVTAGVVILGACGVLAAGGLAFEIDNMIYLFTRRHW